MEKFKFIRYTEIPKKHVLQKQQKELKEAGFNISYAELKKQQLENPPVSEETK